jgi:hypothetical protein
VSLNSIVIVPDTLSDEQKLQYEVVSVASTAQNQPSSLPEMMETIDPNVHTGDSGTVPSGTPLPKLPSGTVEDVAHAALLSSSPPVSAMNRKMKRAKSEVSSPRMATSATTNSHNKVVTRKGRSKTIAPGEEPPRREASVDELSLTSLESVRKTVSREASMRTRKKRARDEDEEELMSNDELHTFEETGPEKEQYQPRPSLRRSRSISIDTSTDGADLGLPKATAVRRKSSKATVTPSYSALGDKEFCTATTAQASVIQDNSAMETITEGRVRLTASLIPESIGDSHNTAGKSTDVPVVETVPTVPVQPKKRSRKKTSEIVTVKSNGVSKTQLADSVLVSSKDNEAQRKVLHETDSNHQPLQETASTPPTKTNTTVVTELPALAQTPTKDSKKGPDQHSPLQSGKVPYRIGLSKKTRIAPLLKMIRK